MAKLKRFLPLAFVLCLFGLVFGAKLWVIDRFGSDLPNWDQWDAEGRDLYLPYFQHHLGFLDFFKPQNEHRIVFTKMLNFALLLAGRQWDMRVQCVVNAVLHSAFALAAFLVGRRLLAAHWHAVLFAACGLLFGLPVAWFNILNGFQSQFYFLQWFSLSAIALLCFARVWSGPWWIGLALGVLANFSMASGLLAAVAIAGVLLLRLLRRHTAWGDIWPTLAGCALAVAVGLITRVPTPPWHVALKSQSFHDFAYTIIHIMQWPNYGPPWFALVVFAPAGLILWQALRHRAGDMRGENLLLASSLWLLLQYAATGYARGVGAPWPVSRYLDMPAFGMIINGVTLAFLLDRAPLARGWGIARRLLCLVWLLVVSQGLWHHTHLVFTKELPDTGKNFHDCECNVRAYLMTGDNARLDGQTIPYPNPVDLSERLDHPEIRAILPTSVRPPLNLTWANTPAGVFVADNGSLPKRPPSLKCARVWSTPGTGASQGEWHSVPFTPAFDGYLRMDMAGYPGAPGMALLLQDASTGTPLAGVQPTRQPRESWRSAFVRAPRRPLVLAATDQNSQSWMAFSEPVEMSMLSYRTLRLAKQGWLIFIFSAAATLLLCLLAKWSVLRSWRGYHSRLLGSPGWLRLKQFYALMTTPAPPAPPQKGRFGPWLIGAAIGLALFKLWLVSAQTICAIGWADHDDRLFINLAGSILSGQWLGPYSQFTLMKGPMYSIFIAVVFLMGVPLFAAQQLLYIAACGLATRALRPLIPCRWLRFAIFAVVLFNPVTYDSDVHGRVLRQDILPGLVLMIMAGLIAIYARRREPKRRLLPWVLLTGIALPVFWMTREEGVWLLPCAGLLWAAAALAVWHDRTTDRRARLVLLALPALMWVAGVCTVSFINLRYYGVFTVCEFKRPEFKDAFGALLRVEPKQWRQYITVPREVRERLYPLSPTFAELRPSLEGSMGEAWAAPAEGLTHLPAKEREMAGWFMWAMRDATAAAGHCQSGAEAMAFYGKMAKEINEACDSGKIKAGPRRSGFLPPLRREYLHPFIETSWQEIRFFVGMEEMHTAPFDSMGSPESLVPFADLTRGRLSPLPDGPHIPPKQHWLDRVRLGILDKIGQVYPLASPLIGGAALVALLAGVVLALIRRRASYFLAMSVGFLGSVLALVVINSLIEITSFPALNTGYFTGGYGLWLFFMFTSWLALAEVLRPMPCAPATPTGSP